RAAAGRPAHVRPAGEALGRRQAAAVTLSAWRAAGCLRQSSITLPRAGATMPLVIDGYNLLYALGRLTPRSGRDALDGARRWLVQQLRQREGPGADVTVVFDGRSARGPKTKEDQGDIRVVFSQGASADDVIEEMI